jgi:flavodoxin
MKVNIIFSSVYGNTKEVTNQIADSLSEFFPKTINVMHVRDASLLDCDLLIIGSPTHGGRATSDILKFLNNLKEEEIKEKRVAVFDTRLEAAKQAFALKMLMKVIGYAAPKMASYLKRRGARVLAQAGFIVSDKTGPLDKNVEKEINLFVSQIKEGIK